MKYEIDIDLPPDVAAKYVPVAYRQAEPGESFLVPASRQAVVAKCGTGGEHIILAPRVEWPAWCSADWIAKDGDGTIFAFLRDKPEWSAEDGEWLTKNDEFYWLCPATHASLYAAFEHVPPELSLIQNPNRTNSDSAA